MGRIYCTRNYRLFERSVDNRGTDPAKRHRLQHSMELYGFLEEFHIIVVKGKGGQWIVKDGQHRLAIAEKLGLPVYYMEATQDWDVALVNSTPKPWMLKDYAETWMGKGKPAYQEIIEFSESCLLPIGTAAALLSGNTNFSNVQKAFVSGEFKVKDREWAESVASIYMPIVTAQRKLRNARFIEACMAVCRVSGFETKRLLQNMERCRDKLVPYSTRDAYLEMLETVYNFGRAKLVGLKVAALSAMRERNPGCGSNGKKNGALV